MAPSCKGWKRSSWLSAHLDRPADRRSLGPAGTSCCSTSTAAQVHCEPPNCNSPLGPLLVHQTLMLPERIAIAGAVHLFQRGLCCSTTLHTPASSAPDKDLILKLCLFHPTFWRSPPIHNRLAASYCFTIRFCQLGGSRDWGSVYGLRCKSLLPEKPPQAELHMGWHHSSGQ